MKLKKIFVLCLVLCISICMMSGCKKKNEKTEVQTSEKLNVVTTIFPYYDFVKSIAGVDNVCERSAVLASGGCLKLRKTAHDGVTLAVAEEPLIIDF